MSSDINYNHCKILLPTFFKMKNMGRNGTYLAGLAKPKVEVRSKSATKERKPERRRLEPRIVLFPLPQKHAAT